MDSMGRAVGILGLGSALPEQILTNRDIEQMVDTTDEWIVARTGIRERRRADENTATSDLATLAAERALADANLAASDLDLIIVGTVTPDMFFPSTACLVQSNLGATRAAAFDLEAACSGFLYGLTVAQQFVSSGFYQYVLVIGAETLTKITDWTDRNTCVLFGDGAGAAVLGPVSQGRGILANRLGADGNGGYLLHMPGGGSRMPVNQEVLDQRLHYIKMAGNEVFKFAVRTMANTALAALADCGLNKDSVRMLIPHQANRRIIDAVSRKLGLAAEQVMINVDRTGNTSAASIPLALDEAYRNGCFADDDVLVLVGFGGGLTWGASVIRWGV
ncbi:MAG: beta-ketoacyl-ACP synthase III [Bacillota bacterium]